MPEVTIHKNGDTSDPAHFRPIAITSVIGKLFHNILAVRLDDFLVENGVINRKVFCLKLMGA